MKTKTIGTLMTTLFLTGVLAVATPAFANNIPETLEIESRGGTLNWILGYSFFEKVRKISFEAEVRGASGRAKLEINAIATTGEKIELKARWNITEDWTDPGTPVLYNGEGTAMVKINRVRTTYMLNTVRFGSYDYIDLHIAGGIGWDDVFRVSYSPITKLKFEID